jgi:hypothetical protein
MKIEEDILLKEGKMLPVMEKEPIPAKQHISSDSEVAM